MLPVARLVLVKAMRRACDPTMRRRRFCPPLLYQLHKRYHGVQFGELFFLRKKSGRIR